MRWGLLLALILPLLSPPAASQDRLEYVARVIEGDKVEIDGTRNRLNGIDAPESDQLCRRRMVRDGVVTRNPPSRLPTLSAVLSCAANRVIATGMAASLLFASRVISI